MLRFEWRSPKQKTLRYNLVSIVKTQNKYNPIKEKITYPIRNKLDRGYNIFLNPTLHIDSMNDAIKAKAKEIVREETDLYIIVSKTANWVNKQVEYDINTKTEKATQKASWVMQNKQGVCDEITSLFIALLRAADIPARFVSGISYTNIPEAEQNWGHHGWAEVYYPERGWLPYDITFGQYGWIDLGHIKLKETLDPREKPTRFEWQGRDVGLKANPLEITAEIQEKGEKIEPIIDIRINIAKEKTGFGSFNLVIAEIKNLKDFYITKELILADVNELTIQGAKKKLAILKPNERKKLYWRIKVEEELDSRYEYKIPIAIYTATNETSTTQFETKDSYKTYSLTDIAELQDSIEAGIIQVEYTEQIVKEPEEVKQEEKKSEPPKIVKKAPEPGTIQKIIKWIKSLFT
jgi:hypothetical protein